MRTDGRARWYELSSRALLWPMRLSAVRQPLTLFSKVWLRHARIFQHLRSATYDGIIDGGASIGEFAALARLARPTTPLVCVEPHPASAAVLRRRGFHVIEAALWHERGTLELTQPSEAVTSCTLLAEGTSGRPRWQVQAVRMDELPIQGQRLLVKLDLQGAEAQALAGLGDWWDRCAGLLLEVSYGPAGTYEPLRRMLAEKGFSEAATFNELEDGGKAIEADKLWTPAPAPSR